jgi:hypothetical protein
VRLLQVLEFEVHEDLSLPLLSFAC